MKKTLLILAAGMCATSAWANDNSVTLGQRQQPQPRKPIVEAPRGEGSIQKGIRSGNPLQLINPLAPAEYGSGSDYVYYEDSEAFQHAHPGKAVPRGIRLFGFVF